MQQNPLKGTDTKSSYLFKLNCSTFFKKKGRYELLTYFARIAADIFGHICH